MSWSGYGHGSRGGFVVSAAALAVITAWLVLVAAGVVQ